MWTAECFLPEFFRERHAPPRNRFGQRDGGFARAAKKINCARNDRADHEQDRENYEGREHLLHVVRLKK